VSKTHIGDMFTTYRTASETEHKNSKAASWSIPSTTEKKIINYRVETKILTAQESKEEIRRIHGLRIIPARFDNWRHWKKTSSPSDTELGTCPKVLVG
jgi:hypothetical protein